MAILPRVISPARSRSVVVLLLLALLSSACESSSTPTSPAPPAASASDAATGGQATGAGATPARVAATIATLANSGVAVYRSPADEAPISRVPGESVIDLTLSQATAIADESPSGGLLGRDLDALARGPAGALPISYLLAAWISTYQSPGAAHVRAEMGARDWTHARTVVFPTLGVFLFLADLGSGATAGGLRSARADAKAIALAAFGGPLTAVTLCGQIAGFVSETLAKLFAKIKSGADSVLAVIWNVAVDLAKDVVVGLVTSFTAATLAAIKAAAGVVGTLAYMTSLLRQWQVFSTADDNQKTFGIDAPGPTGIVTVRVDASSQGALPEEVIDCAKLAGADVPSAAPPGRPLTWELISEAPVALATRVAAETDATVRADGMGRLTFQVGDESAAAAKGPARSSSLVVRTTVERVSAAYLKSLVEILLGKLIDLPQAAKDLLAPVTDKAIEEMGDLARPWSYSTVQVHYHQPPDCPVEDGSWGGRFGQDIILKTANGVGGRLVSAGTMTLQVSCTDVTAGHLTFTEWGLVAGLDTTGVTVTCAGTDLTYTVTSGTVGQTADGLPTFELAVQTGGTVACDPTVPLPGGTGATIVTMRATAQHENQLVGVSDDLFTFEDPRVTDALDLFIANGGSYTATTGWTLNLGPPATPFPSSGTATPVPSASGAGPGGGGPDGIVTIGAQSHPFAVTSCAFSKAESEAAGIGDLFSAETNLLISGTTTAGDALTVDVISNDVLGDSIEVYSTDLTTSWIASTSLSAATGAPDASLKVAGRTVTADTSFFDRGDGTLDTSNPVPGTLEVTCP